MATTYEGSFINNDWTGGTAELQVSNPADGSVCGAVSGCGAEQADAALQAAATAFKTWGATSIDVRAEAIGKYAVKLKEHKATIVDLLVKETGKVSENAEYDFNMLVDCLDYHVQEVRRANGTVFQSPDNSTLSYTRNTPVGVVVAVLTWNFPLLNLGYKLGPILATGCTCVIKPAEVTPLATSMCVSLINGTGIPPGVVNLVNGTGLALLGPLCGSKVPRLLTTIGSTAMGKRMIAASATSIKRFSLELGGDAPVLVFADAKLDKAVDDIIGLKYANGGQICVSPNRVFVEKSIYDKFLEKAAEKCKSYVFGAGRDDKNSAGAPILQPLVSEDAVKRMQQMISDAVEKGARIVTGGQPGNRAGFFLEPTILADVNPSMDLCCTEIFGPILAVQQFETIDTAFECANNSEYGLSGYVYTTNLDTMLRAENELLCGNVLINGAHYSIELPHGGLKQSGCGKDISSLSLRDYYDIRRISVKR